MIRIYLLLVSILFSSTSFKTVGSGIAYLVCKSESGRTLFNAELQDIVGIVEKAELIVDGKKIAFSYEGGDEAFTIFDPHNNVFTLHISGKPNKEFPNSRFIEFWAIPSSFKIISSDHSNQKYEFKAKVVGTEPRKNKDLRTPEVIVNCTLEYKI
ncbi:hypothetical protein [Terrimonas pollutisoli]|uniref:hypothetical protein n=1 Tax=Terrimonas pollutisoli TaxID=3034147 RepID=UPI0023EDBEE5|nr:hypothetical protein [Terrimonas sp. H1YJ31]